jgi:hypothetical protein
LDVVERFRFFVAADFVVFAVDAVDLPVVGFVVDFAVADFAVADLGFVFDFALVDFAVIELALRLGLSSPIGRAFPTAPMAPPTASPTVPAAFPATLPTVRVTSLTAFRASGMAFLFMNAPS